jgi:hypothetical protein
LVAGGHLGRVYLWTNATTGAPIPKPNVAGKVSAGKASAKDPQLSNGQLRNKPAILPAK